MKFNSFTDAYYHLVRKVNDKYDYESAPRGQKVRESLAVSFSITDPRHRLLYIPERDFPLCYVVAESLWYLLGENRTDWISNYSAFWNNISDDGTTANSAYGARIFKKNHKIADGKLIQWDYVKEELKRDPDSRRAVILIRTPEDALDAHKDMPCTLSLQFFIRGGKLDLVVTMRSTDLILGLTNDVPAFTLFQELMAFELGIPLGTYYHTSNSLHIYERHFEMAKKIIAGEEVNREANALTWKPIPAFTDTPPTGVLDRIQEVARECIAIPGVKDLHDRIKGGVMMSDRVSDYWRDWAYLLLAHRAGKLGDETLKRQLIQSTSFGGFHVFNK